MSETATFCPTCGVTAPVELAYAGIARVAAPDVGVATADASAAVDDGYASPAEDWRPPSGDTPGGQSQPTPAAARSAPQVSTAGSRLKSWVLTDTRSFKILGLAFVCLLVVLGFARGALVGNAVHSLVEANRITLEDYRQLQVGQTNEQVDAILTHGSGGQPDPGTENARVHRVQGDGSYVDLWFVNGRLQSFSQSGLAATSATAHARSAASRSVLAIFSLLQGLVTTVAWFFCLYLLVRWRGYNLTLKQLVVMAVVCGVVSAAGGTFLPFPLGLLLALVVSFGFLLAWTQGDLADAVIIALGCMVASWLVIGLPTYLGLWISVNVTR